MVKKEYKPHDSVIIQAGILFVIVSAIAITAYVFANFFPINQVGAGY
ncbi:MAG: hypothetical protein US54_C0026G0001 [Candidatus Roizmanbacteria bacterium GW2011_GWA2_37_7]|uniref:Uncharacterized protein n=1 Tax=Candidatus Roizmanbacteria bacterium GW2011_GWA2_37_7 TaxID=1618481 RepID=A0A0G0H6I0_9BACT|nr:MAG: hypothetical protein US54_C0026G0001 [Candidatus Roizmanbacteria bacterium GW2011_GWA2_37_7]